MKDRKTVAVKKVGGVPLSPNVLLISISAEKKS